MYKRQAWFVGEELYWKALTEKGQTLTDILSGLLADADAEDEKKLSEEQTAIRAIVEKLPYSHLSLELSLIHILSDPDVCLCGDRCI